MSTTPWERRKALSDQLRGVWDTKRDGTLTWESAFNAARDALAHARETDARLLREMDWPEFQRLQGWHQPLDVAEGASHAD